jgi:hypothetical protein
MGIEAICPHCNAHGTIAGGHPDVTPTTVRCGACEQTFTYTPTALERVTSEALAAPETPFYLKPKKGRPGSRKGLQEAPEGPEDLNVQRSLTDEEQAERDVRRVARLKGLTTERLINLLRQTQRGHFKDAGLRRPVHALGTWYSFEELKAELTTREHHPTRRERRQQRAKTRG